MTTAVDDIAEAWQQRWPALRLAYLYASPNEAEKTLPSVLLALELGAARYALSDQGIARRKLGFWAEEFAAAADARHPLSVAIGLRADALNPALMLIDDFERAHPETTADLLSRLVPIADSLARICSGDAAAPSVYRLLWAACHALARLESLPLAHMPLSEHARGAGGDTGDNTQAATRWARTLGEAMTPVWSALPKTAFHGRRGHYVLGCETLHDLTHARLNGAAPTFFANLARGFRSWRAAARIQ